MNFLLNLFAGQQPAGIAVTALIAALFLIGLFDVLRSRVRLKNEQDTIWRARLALAREGALPINSAAELLQYLRARDGSLLAARVTRVLRLRAAGLGHREVLQKLTLENVQVLGSHSRFIATVLTLLGLLGTVVGMSLAMQRMSDAFGTGADASAFPRMMQALNGTVAGMKTAFACTLAGLAGAVILSACNHMIRRAQSVVVRNLEDLVVYDFLPRLESIDPDSEQATKAFANVLSNAAERLEKLTTAFEAAAREHSESSGRMQQAIGAFGTAITGLSSATAGMVGNQQEFTKTMAENRGSIDALRAFLEEQLRRLNASQDSSQKLMQERLAALERSQKDSRELQDSIAAYNATFKEFVTSSAAQLQKACEGLVAGISKHYQDAVRGHVDQTHREFAALLQEHTAKLQSFSSMMLELHLNGKGATFAGAKQ